MKYDRNLISEMKTASPRMPSPLTAGITRLAYLQNVQMFILLFVKYRKINIVICKTYAMCPNIIYCDNYVMAESNCILVLYLVTILSSRHARVWLSLVVNLI